MSTDANFGPELDEVVSHFSKRIYFILWFTEVSAFFIVVSLLPEFRKGDYAGIGLMTLLAWSTCILASVVTIVRKLLKPEGRRWLLGRPPSSLNTKAAGPLMRFIIWAVPVLGIVGILVSRLYFL